MTTFTTYDRTPVTQALLVALRGFTLPGKAYNLPVGDSGPYWGAPMTTAQATDGRYAVLREINGGYVDDDDLSGNIDAAALVWQLDTYAQAPPDLFPRRQAGWLADELRQFMRNVPLSGPGWTVTARWLDVPGAAEPERDDLAVVHERWALKVAPA